MVEREARCLALEQAYVHEVYHQMGGGDQRQHPPWPRVTQFLNKLEPGSLVCDVGCGNGKYLSINPSVFKIGGDRCSRLAEHAREDQNEVLVCDNLALPFRDESFDAVLSIAVVHHFATTERRIGAIKELARVLRIGGRLVITVWAMEQRHRKFESQDVLVPWHRPKTLSTPSLELTPTTTTSEEDSHHHLYTACTHTSDSDSCRSARGAGAKRSKCKHKEVAPSPSSSSLSSPNESCYSFVRRALKKLAGVKRDGDRSKPWFLESWTSCTSKEPPPRRYDPDGCEDIQDLPIELRRLEDDQETIVIKKQIFSCSKQVTEPPLNHKSKSLTDIITTDQRSLVRSHSSVPSLEIHETKNNDNNISTNNKPKLVKQKKSVCDDDVESEERDKAMDMKDLVKSLPEFKISGFGINRRGNVFKQSSMNEELMSAERLKEKEKVRQNIQKQASLNEELIYNRNNKTFDSLKDTLFSTSTAKRFQLLKNGLTNKIKSSTTGIEKVAGASIKNGFVRILQGWTSGDSGLPTQQPTPPPQQNEFKAFVLEKKEQPSERRHSREDGSDSSKDSSLQSDTSVDSEDSFASVIFVPKSDPMEQQSTNTSPTMQSTPASPQPTSPKIKFPPPVSPKMKNPSQMPFGLPSHPSSPKIKHPAQLMSSTTTPTSPKIKYFPQPTSPRTYPTTFLTSPTTRNTFKFQMPPNNNGGVNSSQMNKPPTPKTFGSFNIPQVGPPSPTEPSHKNETSPSVSSKPLFVPSPSLNKMEFSSFLLEKETSDQGKLGMPALSPGLSPTAVKKPLAAVKVGPLTSSEVVLKTKEESTVKKEASAHPNPCSVGVSSVTLRSQYPLVRRSATMHGRTDTPLQRPVPRLLSLEIFNPETDDMDSDSSGLSSPDSVGSVISIKYDDEAPAENIESSKQNTNGDKSADDEEESTPVNVPIDDTTELNLELEEPTESSARLSPLLEAAADVANTLEETVDVVIQSSPQAKRKQYPLKSDVRLALQDNLFENKNLGSQTSLFHEKAKDELEKLLSVNYPGMKSAATNISLVDNKNTNPCADSEEYLYKRWDEECRQHLAEFAEKLSEKLLAEIDRYREQSSIQPASPVYVGDSTITTDLQDPYLCKLSEDLQDLTKLSYELQEKSEHDLQMYIEEKQHIEKFESTFELKGRTKGEGASMDEKCLEEDSCDEEHLKSVNPIDLLLDKQLLPLSSKQRSTAETNQEYLPEEQIPLLQEYNDESQNVIVIVPSVVEPLNPVSTDENLKNSFLTKVNEPVIDNLEIKKEESISSLQSDSGNTDNSAELSDPDSTESEGTWTDSRRNTILPGKGLFTQTSLPQNESPIPMPLQMAVKDETIKFELLPAKDMPRRPSISIEMSEPQEIPPKEKENDNQLHLGISLESSEAGDISERTGSSSEGGSRPSSRRETIQICDSGSVLSLRPGLSIESSEAGDYSDRAGSDGSRDSRRDAVSFGDITSSSQNSLLRPGNSIESSEAGDVSDRTGSDFSRQNTSSAGKTPSTASFASDKASDCSKDARFADRRMARCDGRSSSEEMPIPRTCMNKLVRQRASTQEPSELLAKAQSCETSLSGSTSQDSLLSDSGGGAITFHRYYHVFREGELDQLIERYVENLHIISSYYDHANWCVVAEKVQVWTI
ncbi:uncharacterized protein LOC106667224 isoform X2 [Cimex lectularius]|uniref:Methyltransferase type 11 domain-containing protein n=1 Tax=Cimex lectularius TaxID=79782 RepID=A0A8I6TJM6_CIMLE|nr:uncharacterized protein LOC106667224 isoform X2 [Cimex lectularius]